MISIFDYQDPVEFLKAYVNQLPPRKKRGIYNRLSEAASVFPSYLSQILSGKRQFNLDQALGVGEFLELSTKEKRYFLLLVEKTRAASQRLQQELQKQIEETQAAHNRISSHVQFDNFEVNEEEQARFYSSWIYAAIRLATALPECHESQAIAKNLHLPQKTVDRALSFLAKTGLCQESESGWTVGPKHTHLHPESPHIISHHRSWRLKAIDTYPTLNLSQELAYSVAACLSREDALKIRQMLIQTIAELRKISDPSPSECLYALNLDWIQVTDDGSESRGRLSSNS